MSRAAGLLVLLPSLAGLVPLAKGQAPADPAPADGTPPPRTLPAGIPSARTQPPGTQPARTQPAPRAPDPRRGERLDGRPTPRDPKRRARAVARISLAVPRFLIEALFWPVARIASFVERHHLLARTYWAFTSEDRLVGLRPTAKYETGLLTSVGVRFFDRRSLGRGSLVELRARSAGPRFLYGEMRLQAPDRSPISLELRSLYDRSANQVFAGTRGQRRAELEDDGRGVASYSFDRALTSLAADHQVGFLEILLRGDLDLRTYRSTDSLDAFYCDSPGTPSCVVVDDGLVPGFDEGLRVVRGAARVVLDTRHSRRRLDGVRFALDGAISRGILGDPSVQARVVADARVVLDLSDRVLIMRANAGVVAPLGDQPVPFEELMAPGGSDGLRGLSSGRLRGHSQIFGSLEYRWLLAPYLDATVFVDHGGAFDRGFAGASLDRMIPGYGFGLRIHDVRGDYWNAVPLLRLQIAHAPGEGFRLFANLWGGD